MDRQADANIALLRAAYDRYQAGDIAHVFSLLDDNVQWVSSGDPKLFPLSTARSGPAQVAAYFQQLQQDWTVESHEPLEFFGTGDRVAVRTRVRVRNNHTGGVSELDKMELWTVRDGRIHSFQEIFDSGTLTAVMPPAAFVSGRS